MLGEDGVGVTADGSATVAENSGNALKLFPDVVLDVDRMTVHHLCRSEERSLELGEIRFALLLADALLLRWLGCGSCLGCRLFVAEQIFIGNGVGYDRDTQLIAN